VMTTDRSGKRAEREDLEGFTLLRRKAFPRRRDYYFAPGIYRHILGGGYEIVHCQGIHTAVPVLAMLAARRRRIPYVVTLHAGGHSSSLRRHLRQVQWRAVAPLLRGAAVIVAVSRFEQRMFQKACSLDSSRFRIIRNGGDLPMTTGRAEVIPGRIVSSARLERYKGHQRVIEALPIVQRAIPGATLRILGSGPYERQLRSLVGTFGLENSVTIERIPASDRERMAAALGTAAVVACMSEYESNPVAVMEALALGIPAVGLDTAGTSDLVAEGLVRGVPENASPAAVAAALIAAQDDRDKWVPPELPTWDAAAAELTRVYAVATASG
jgi:glycosyltransferase involved in cell wall biosynthesis